MAIFFLKNSSESVKIFLISSGLFIEAELIEAEAKKKLVLAQYPNKLTNRDKIKTARPKGPQIKAAKKLILVSGIRKCLKFVPRAVCHWRELTRIPRGAAENLTAVR